MEKLKKTTVSITINYKKEKTTTKLQKKKQYDLNKRIALIRNQNESNREKNNVKENKKEFMIEDVDSGRYFELPTTKKIYVNGLNLHQIKSKFLEDYTGDFEIIGSILIGKIEQKTNIRFKNVDDFETYTNAIDNSGYDSDDVFFTE